MSKGEFAQKLLNGVAIGIVVGLIPNAILGEVFKALQHTSPIFGTLLMVVRQAQSTVPILIGCLVAVQFGFNAIETASLGAVTFIGSGIVRVVQVDNRTLMTLVGIGDLINIILVAFIAVVLIKLLQGKFGSLSMILIPVVVITLVGAIGYISYPYVREVSVALGNAINSFTKLQPLLMSILISIAFSVIIISPISTVAIAYAIGITGLASGAANIGIATCAMTLVIGSIHARNKSGITVAVFVGSMKLFIPNWIRHPIINLPIVLNAILGGFITYLFGIQGTAASAGFGFSGLVGPIAAFRFMEGSAGLKVLYLFLAYFVLTGIGAYIVDFVCVKVLKLYTHEIYYFEGQ